MTKIQIIPGNFKITDPDWPLLDFVASGGTYTSDTMSEDGSLVGAYSDAGLGGMARQWLTTGDGGWTKQGGIARSTSIDIAGFQPPTADYKTSIKVEEFPNLSTSLAIANRRSTMAFSGLTEYVEARILTTGYISLVAREGTTIRTIGTTENPINIGDTVTLSTFGNEVEVLVNGGVVLSGNTTVAEAGYAVVRTTYNGPDARTGAFSNFVINMERDNE